MNGVGKTHVKDKAPLQSRDHILEEKEEKGRGKNRDPPEEDPLDGNPQKGNACKPPLDLDPCRKPPSEEGPPGKVWRLDLPSKRV